MSECLEHMKLLSVTGKSQLIREFMTWLITEQGIELNGDEGKWKRINMNNVDVLIEDYFGLDSTQLDQEALELEVEAEYLNGRLP
jgi:peptide subunit release factor 1 (eRF1)